MIASNEEPLRSRDSLNFLVVKPEPSVTPLINDAFRQQVGGEKSRAELPGCRWSVRARKPYTAVTHAEHRPKAHQAHLEWPPSRLVDWAQKTGRFSAQLFQQILDRYPHPEMGYRSCLGLLRLGEKYGPKRLESACERALVTGATTYKSVKSICRTRWTHSRAHRHRIRRGPPGMTTFAALVTTNRRRRCCINQP
jgi:transposase